MKKLRNLLLIVAAILTVVVWICYEVTLFSLALSFKFKFPVSLLVVWLITVVVAYILLFVSLGTDSKKATH